MIKVIVECVGSGKVRTIQIGIKPKTMREESLRGIICSPRILAHTGSIEKTRKPRSWKDTKCGHPHANRNWQRHLNRKPSRRRARWGKHRRVCYPSARILNDLSRCIHPNINNKYLT